MIKKLLTIVLAFVFGVFLLIYGFKEYRQAKKLQASGQKTTAQVTDFEERTGRKGRVSCYLTASFKTESGQSVTTRSRVSSAVYSAAVHSKEVPVCYLPSDASICRFGSEVETELMPMGLGAFLLGFSVVSVARRSRG